MGSQVRGYSPCIFQSSPKPIQLYMERSLLQFVARPEDRIGLLLDLNEAIQVLFQRLKQSLPVAPLF